MTLIEIAGILPALIFPGASLLQLFHLLKTKTSEGVSIPAWSAFAVGNISLYIYTEKYDQLQAIVGMLGTCVLQIIIVLLVIRYRAQDSRMIQQEAEVKSS
ncbi:hypothetical protein [Spongorhabdus nitratireducens]